MTSNRNRIFLLALAAICGIVAMYMKVYKDENYSLTSTSTKEEILNDTTSENTIITDSGLQYKIINRGSENINPGPNSVVKVHYVGKLTDGTEFDSSYKRNQPATFPVNGVIRGWTEALQLMHVGDKFELIIPPDLGYGNQGAGAAIPPNATLIFEVELLEIK